MNIAALVVMSRSALLRQRQLVAIIRMNNANKAMVSSARSQSSSSSTPASPSGSTPATFGTGDFGRAAPVAKDVTMPPLRPEDTPGPDENPYSYSPVYRQGRFDWLFGDGWRRPPAKDQGQRMRRDWFCFGWYPTDEYLDWKYHHTVMFCMVTLMICGSAFVMAYRPDWPVLRDWGTREAYIEIARREKYGLPLISKDYIDPAKIAAALPSDEELGDFEIII